MKAEGILKRKDFYTLEPSTITVREGWNPRTNFNTPDDMDLCRFVIDNGPSFPPIFVRNTNEGIELVDGERRLRAVLAAIASGCEIEGIPAIFIDRNSNDIEQLSLALTANQGKPLLPIEEAGACKRLKDWGLEEVAIAKRIGKSSAHVRNRLVLVNASPAVAAAVEEGTITQGEAMETIKGADGSIEKQDEKLERIRKPTAQKAPQMMSRLKVGKAIDELVEKANEIETLDFDKLDSNSTGIGVLVGMTMVLKNMNKDEAFAEVFLKFNEKPNTDSKAPWEAD